MKNNLLKWYVFAFLMVSGFVMFAQDPTNGSGIGENVEGGGDENPGVAPINAKLLLLAIVGISFAFYYYKKMQQEKQINA